MTDEEIRQAARFAYEIMKHPMFGKFPKPPGQQAKPKRTKKTKPPVERQFALKEDEE